MHNPFTEPAPDQTPDEVLVRDAQAGDRDALERLIRRHQAWVYNLVVRVVWWRDLAEDATQEVLIKIVTKLGSFRGESSFRTWAYRIAINHALSARQVEAEKQGMNFTKFAYAVDHAPDQDLPDHKSVGVELPLLVEEAKVGCMAAMLLCLDRRQRLVFTLGELFGVSDRVGGELMDMTPANFRQVLSRSRRDLYAFMNDKCGLVKETNPCRCRNKTRHFIANGWVDPHKMKFVREHFQRIQDVAPSRCEELESMVEREHAEVWRDTPFLTVPDQVAALRRPLDIPRDSETEHD